MWVASSALISFTVRYTSPTAGLDKRRRSRRRSLTLVRTKVRTKRPRWRSTWSATRLLRRSNGECSLCLSWDGRENMLQLYRQYSPEPYKQHSRKRSEQNAIKGNRSTHPFKGVDRPAPPGQLSTLLVRRMSWGVSYAGSARNTGIFRVVRSRYSA